VIDFLNLSILEPTALHARYFRRAAAEHHID
jgi:hypothetical protein